MPHPPLDTECQHPQAMDDEDSGSAEADAAEARKCRELPRAAEQGNVAAVRSFLRTEPETLEKELGFKTSLMLAADKGHAEVVKLLLAAGAKLEARHRWQRRLGGDDKTSLQLATDKGHLEVVKLLLAAGASSSTRDHQGFTPLHQAAIRGHVVVAELLLASGAGVNERQSLPLGSGVNERKTHVETTPLWLAARFGHEAMIELLLSAGARMNDAPSPLSVAANSGHAGVVQLLLSKGATMPSKVLHGAASNGDVDVVKVLLAARASVNARNGRGDTPWDCARFGGQGARYQEVLDLLNAAQEREAEQKALEEARRKAEDDSRPKRCFGLCPRR
mmetsp:Transcript_51125/g.95778  ORF Transcript_51125/g.95778 Transcript_51125/m.95778 type:complete len:334 (-) Transcript_51125:190-1191(-)